MKIDKMQRLLLYLNLIRGFFPWLVLSIIAHRRQPHPVALRETGIRIVSLWENEKQLSAFKEEIWQALQLLHDRDEMRLKRVAEQIRTVFVAPIVRSAFYLRNGKFCILNPQTIPFDCEQDARFVAIAGALVHEATHGLFDQKRIPFNRLTKSRIERICDLERSRAFEKLRFHHN